MTHVSSNRNGTTSDNNEQQRLQDVVRLLQEQLSVAKTENRRNQRIIAHVSRENNELKHELAAARSTILPPTLIASDQSSSSDCSSTDASIRLLDMANSTLRQKLGASLERIRVLEKEIKSLHDDHRTATSPVSQTKVKDEETVPFDHLQAALKQQNASLSRRVIQLEADNSRLSTTTHCQQKNPEEHKDNKGSFQNRLRDMLTQQQQQQQQQVGRMEHVTELETLDRRRPKTPQAGVVRAMSPPNRNLLPPTPPSRNNNNNKSRTTMMSKRSNSFHNKSTRSLCSESGVIITSFRRSMT